jgi:hypothetical protein
VSTSYTETRVPGEESADDFSPDPPPPVVATDSEWDVSQISPWLSTTFASAGGVVVFVRDDVPPQTRARLQAEARNLGCAVRFVTHYDSTNLLPLARRALKVRGTATLVIYYSCKDVEYALSWDRFQDAIDAGHVRQRRVLTGKVAGAKLHDLFGWSCMGLERFAKALGLSMCHKGNLDDYKRRMHDALLERTEDYLFFTSQGLFVKWMPCLFAGNVSENIRPLPRLGANILPSTLPLPPATYSLPTGARVGLWPPPGTRPLG